MVVVDLPGNHRAFSPDTLRERVGFRLLRPRGDRDAPDIGKTLPGLVQVCRVGLLSPSIRIDQAQLIAILQSLNEIPRPHVAAVVGR